MKILLVNHTLDHYAGSETFTYSLACELKRLTHEAICFSPRLGRLAERLREANIVVSDDLTTLPTDVDIVHAHHRHESLLAFARFPYKPMILVCHGVLPWQEQPLRSRLNVHRYVAVSEEVRDHLTLHHRIDPADIMTIRNGIDLQRFVSHRPIAERPRRALVLSNYMPDHLRGLIDRVCARLGMTVTQAGRPRSLWAVEEEINRADLVFALGRSALEALACKRAVIVFDYNGADGLVTPENFSRLRLRNFSGRTYRRQYTEDTLRKEIEQYDSATAETLYQMVKRDHDLREMAQRYVGLYEDAVSQPLWGRPGPEEFALRRYRAETELIEEIRDLRTLVDAKTQSIQSIHESRGWRALSAIRRIRHGITSCFDRSASRPRRTRILVVDDDPLLTGWLADALALEGYEVDVADNGHAALQRLDHTSYDLIMSDLRMPHMDGVELYRRLERERPQVARRVMFLSGYTDASEFGDFLSDVRDRSMPKPIDLSSLHRVVRHSLDSREN